MISEIEVLALPIIARAQMHCAPREIRTPVLALKGLRPGPLDDGGISQKFYHILVIYRMERARDRSRVQPLDAFRGVVAGVVDRQADGMRAHLIRRVGRQHRLQGIRGLIREPTPAGGLIKDDGHAVMHIRDEIVRWAGDDRAGADCISFGRTPGFPDASKRERRAARELKVERSFGYTLL